MPHFLMITWNIQINCMLWWERKVWEDNWDSDSESPEHGKFCSCSSYFYAIYNSRLWQTLTCQSGFIKSGKSQFLMMQAALCTWHPVSVLFFHHPLWCHTSLNIGQCTTFVHVYNLFLFQSNLMWSNVHYSLHIFNFLRGCFNPSAIFLAFET